MNMKKMFLLTLATLLATVTFAQKPVAVTPYVAQFLGNKAQPVYFHAPKAELTTVKAGQVSGNKVKKAPSKVQGDYNAIITEVPAGAEVKQLVRKGKCHKYSEGVYSLADQSGSISIAYDGNDVYIQNPVSEYANGAWVKGTKDGNTITVPLGQFLYYSASYNYGLYLTMADVAEDADAGFAGTTDEAATEVTYTIDGETISLNGTSATRTLTVAWSDDNTSYKYSAPGGDYESVYSVYTLPDPVVAPDGLVTKDYPLAATEYEGDNEGVAYNTTVKVGIDGNDVYIQGLCKYVPEAWVKGTKDGNNVVVPVTYFGTDGVNNYFYSAYNGTSSTCEGTFAYDPEDDIYSMSGSMLINLNEFAIDDIAIYNGVTLGIVPDPTTPPDGLEVVEMPCKGRQVVAGGNSEDFDKTVKVGFDGNDVYIQDLLPQVEGGWIKGTITGDKAVFPMAQYVGKNASGTRIFLMGYTSGIEDVVFSYDEAAKLFISDNMILANGRKDALGFYYPYFPSGMTIGNDEDPEPIVLPDGVETKEMPLKAVNSNGEAVERTVKVGINGEDLYIAGLCAYLPDAWAKGTKNAKGNYEFALPQKYGVYGGSYDMYLLGVDADGNIANPEISYSPLTETYTFVNEILTNNKKHSIYYFEWLTAGSKIGEARQFEGFDFNKYEVPVSTNSSHDGDITEDIVIKSGNITLTVSPATAGTPNRFWSTANGPQLRVYSGTLTFEAAEGTDAISKLIFNNGKWNAGNAADNGAFDGNTWTGSTDKLVVTIAGNTQLNNIVAITGDLFAGNAPAEGEFFLYNIDSKLWLQNNNMEKNPNDWTTRAQVDVDGMLVGLVPVDGVENGFVINPHFKNNQSINADNLYMDTGAGKTTWVFTPTEAEGYTNVYTITSGDFKLGVDANGLIANNVEGKWQIITKEDRLAAMANAKADAPVNATWLIDGNNFAFNDEKNDSWKREGDAGGFNIGGDWPGNKNRVLETWNLSNCDIYQEIEVPNGTYQMQAAGAFVPTPGDRMSADDLNAYLAGELKNYGWFYANDQIVQMPSVYSGYRTESTPDRATRQFGDYFVIDGVNQVSRQMCDGGFMSDVITVTVTDGKLRVGAKVTGAKTNTNWIMIDNFRLKYLGTDPVAPETVALTGVSADGEKYYATYFNENKSFTADENTVVKVADYDEETGTVVLFDTNAKEVPAGAAVVLESSAADITLTIGNSTNHFDNNKLVGFQAPKAVAEGDFYGLGNKSKGIGFYKVVLTSLPANKAYMAAKYIADAPAKDFLPFSDGNTTAINGLKNADVENAVIYNMQGQRVNAAQKGVYIVNGKKVIVK